MPLKPSLFKRSTTPQRAELTGSLETTTLEQVHCGGTTTSACGQVMISENVPFQDMEDQWAEVETGWGVPAYVHNSAANAHTHRNRAWWITQGNTEKPLWPTPEMLQAFGPRIRNPRYVCIG